MKPKGDWSIIFKDIGVVLEEDLSQPFLRWMGFGSKKGQQAALIEIAGAYLSDLKNLTMCSCRESDCIGFEVEKRIKELFIEHKGEKILLLNFRISEKHEQISNMLVTYINDFKLSPKEAMELIDRGFIANQIKNSVN